jgi:selenide,water dikinase
VPQAAAPRRTEALAREAAIEVMTTLNADASRQALAAGISCATDVTGFGLLGRLFKLARASGVSSVVDHAAVPLIDGTRAAARAGRVPGGSRRNLQWVLSRTDARAVGEDDLLLLADARRRRAGRGWPGSCPERR